MASSDDEDLQLAIAMSLQEQSEEPEASEPQPAAAANGNTGEAPTTSSAASPANATQPATTSSANAALRPFDRKQLERERLARLEARKRQQEAPSTSATSTDATERPSKKIRTEARVLSSGAEVIDLSSPPRRSANAAPSAASNSFSRAAGSSQDSIPIPPAFLPQRYSASNATKSSAASPAQATNNGSSPTASSGQTDPQYLHGAIKKTWAYGCPRDNDIKLEEVLQRDDLESLALSTWQFETEWWVDKIDYMKTKQIWVIGAPDKATHDSFAEAPNMIPNTSVCFPDMKGAASMNHAKFLILSYPKYLRIVVTTANLTRYDWGETGVMENSVFLVDLPRLPDGQRISEDKLTAFGKEFLYYLRFVNVRANLCDSLLKFDWSRTNHLAFVHSTAGGPFTDDAMKRTGVCGLHRAINQLGLHSTLLELDYATSSLGALSRAFMNQLYTAAQGKEPRGSNEDFDKNTPVGDIVKHFRVFFPTVDTVKSSKGGPDSGGTISLQKRFYDASSFPKSSMRDHKSVRRGLLSHNKILLGRGQYHHSVGQAPAEKKEAGKKTAAPEQRSNVAWVYVGSHNLTQSAWGTLTTDKRSKKQKMSIRNYECGVLMAVPSQKCNSEVKTNTVPGYDVFEGIVPIPFDTAGEAYNGRQPWFSSQHMGR